MQIFPIFQIPASRNLDHGSLVLLPNGNIGLIWNYIQRAGSVGTNLIIDLYSGKTQEADSNGPFGPYTLKFADPFYIKLNIRSAIYDTTLISPGDVIYASYPEGLDDEVIIAASDPYENSIKAVSLTNAMNTFRPAQRYTVAFKEWDLVTTKSDRESIIFSRTPADNV